MICISVVPESRQLAKVDIFNAANQADLVEVCLDHLIKEPEIPDLLEGAKKPILLSCRREIDGGLGRRSLYPERHKKLDYKWRHCDVLPCNGADVSGKKIKRHQCIYCGKKLEGYFSR